jgi:hypothetical protein
VETVYRLTIKQEKMKLNARLILGLTLLFYSCRVHKSIPDFNHLKAVNGKYSGSEYTLVLYAAIGCGYSQAAIKKLQTFEGCNDFQLIVIEDDAMELINEHQKEYFTKTIFYSNEDGKMKFRNFFPQYFLYKDGALIWRKKGYVKNAKKILHTQMKCKL